ncbi:MAG: RNB domain-containing ribonuclease [Nitrososphaerales archaeon]
MSDPFIPSNSLVLYRTRPARVAGASGDKLSIEIESGETAKVRPKDVTLLHPGPLRSLAELNAGRTAADVATAWDLLSGSTTTIKEIAELAFGAFTPATAWAAWQLVAEGVYFRQAGDRIHAASGQEVEQVQAQRASEAAEKAAWEAFLARAKAGKVTGEDRRYLREVEDLAYGRTERSRVLKALGREESPENAHAALLDWGAWDDSVDPHPARAGVLLLPPVEPLPVDLATLLADAARVNLTHLPAYAVDDKWTETPDDALSWEDGPGLGKVWVHVADPAAVVCPDDRLDLDARGRGVTLHLPEMIVPMLPPATTPLLGLGLSEFSPALSFGITVNEAGEITDVEVLPSIVRVARLTYEDATERLEDGPLARLQRVAQVYQARRDAAGAAHIDLPETQVRVRDGEIRIEPVFALPARDVVENCMILTGEAVARYAQDHDIPLPYSTQDPPDAPPNEASPTMSGMFALRRTMKRSQHRSTPGPHAGLGLAAYCQATSPLRRYLDLVVHQQLRLHLAGATLLTAAEMIERIGEIEPPVAAARQAEAQSDKHWTLAWLGRHPGWRGKAMLLDRRGANGIFVIPELAFETSVHLNADLPLDAEVNLVLRSVDLPRLDARFRVEHSAQV